MSINLILDKDECGSMSNSKKIILEMLNDIRDKKSHKRDKNELMAIYIEERLNKHINSYYEQLLSSSETLSHINNKRTLKNLVK